MDAPFWTCRDFLLVLQGFPVRCPVLFGAGCCVTLDLDVEILDNQVVKQVVNVVCIVEVVVH